MERDLKLFSRLILWLWHNHQRPWDYEHETALKIYTKDLMPKGINSFSQENELEQYLPIQGSIRNEFPRRTFLYLNPVTNDQIMVPVLSIKYNFGCTVPEFRCRLGLFLHNNNSLKALGYRFESPEGERGIHHYYHAQIVRGLINDFPPQECSGWLPTSQPAFPIDAKNPIQLILCLLITLYGNNYISQLKLDQYLGSQLEQHMSEMLSRSIKDVKWYWKIQNRNTGKVIKYCESKKSPEEHTDYAKIYPGHDCIAITQNEYNQGTPKVTLS